MRFLSTSQQVVFVFVFVHVGKFILKFIYKVSGPRIRQFQKEENEVGRIPLPNINTLIQMAKNKWITTNAGRISRNQITHPTPMVGRKMVPQTVWQFL